ICSMRLLLFLLALLSSVACTLHRFKTIVDAGQTDCFTVDIKQMSVGVTASYMVISPDSSHDIHFDLRGAQSSYQVKERKQRGIHTFEAAQGEMSLCLDNSYSFSADKLVAISIHINDDVIPLSQIADKTTQAAQSIQRALKLAQNELYDRANVEKRHRTVAENNFESINFWGIVNSCVMIFSSLVQVFLIRRLLK
ncbi:hypothetical protein PENTCL1PPCAC_18262, partial [Pristionchus entomophagus]